MTAPLDHVPVQKPKSNTKLYFIAISSAALIAWMMVGAPE